MIALTLAVLVGMLFATGAYLLLRREPIKLILGLGLLSYGINALLFGGSTMRRGDPPIVEDKAAFAGEISHFVDPLPQALILTAIVISFGVTAFIVVLVNRRNMLLGEHSASGEPTDPALANDPFASAGHYLSGLDSDPDDYEWLEDTQAE
jgi:multisubunit Na+/H+ antiporter MnhC subunit